MLTCKMRMTKRVRLYTGATHSDIEVRPGRNGCTSRNVFRVSWGCVSSKIGGKFDISDSHLDIRVRAILGIC